MNNRQVLFVIVPQAGRATRLHLQRLHDALRHFAVNRGVHSLFSNLTNALINVAALFDLAHLHDRLHQSQNRLWRLLRILHADNAAKLLPAVADALLVTAECVHSLFVILCGLNALGHVLHDPSDTLLNHRACHLLGNPCHGTYRVRCGLGP